MQFFNSIWKNLHLTGNFYTGTACGVCDKYEVCALLSFFFSLHLTGLPQCSHPPAKIVGDIYVVVSIDINDHFSSNQPGVLSRTDVRITFTPDDLGSAFLSPCRSNVSYRKPSSPFSSWQHTNCFAPIKTLGGWCELWCPSLSAPKCGARTTGAHMAGTSLQQQQRHSLAPCAVLAWFPGEGVSSCHP